MASRGGSHVDVVTERRLKPIYGNNRSIKIIKLKRCNLNFNEMRSLLNPVFSYALVSNFSTWLFTMKTGKCKIRKPCHCFTLKQKSLASRPVTRKLQAKFDVTADYTKSNKFRIQALIHILILLSSSF